MGIAPAPCGPGFNPRSPRGGATAARDLSGNLLTFQSTLPAWGSDARLTLDLTYL